MDQEIRINEYKADLFSVNSNVDVFITEMMDWELLDRCWKEIRDRVSLSQKRLDDEFERWNYYLFYLVDREDDSYASLKYRIEHDTISSRKIVIFKKDYGEEDFEKVIGKYIHYTFDMEEETFENRFERNRELEKFLK